MKIPEPVKVSKDRWRIRLRLDGVSKYVYGPTKAKCKDNAALIKSEYKTGKRQIRNAETPTLKRAMEEYIAERKNSRSPSTITGYTRIKDERFQAYMDTPIGELTNNWQKIIDEEIAKSLPKKLSPKTIKNAFYFVKSVYKKYGIIIPDTVDLPVEENHTKAWLDYDQIQTLVNSVKGTPQQLPVLLGLHSLRRSELLALDWKNIDISSADKAKDQYGLIIVSGAVVKDVDGRYVYKTANKNKSSQRPIPILIPELLDALESVPEEERKGRVITINGNSILYEVNKACRAAGVPEVGTHGLRHSFASLAYHLGMPEEWTMRRGGWADHNTMRKIYTHFSDKDELYGDNEMKRFFSNKKGEKTDK